MSRTATPARGPWTLPEATLQKEMVRKRLAKPHPRNTLVWDQCAIEAISCGKCNWSALECCRLFPSLVQVLPIVVSPSCATLVVCRRDQQCTVVHLCPFLAPADTTQGRGKERSMGRWRPRASASSLAVRTSSCLCRRNRTCTVTLLAVHAASAHEA